MVFQFWRHQNDDDIPDLVRPEDRQDPVRRIGRKTVRSITLCVDAFRRSHMTADPEPDRYDEYRIDAGPHL